MFIEMKKDGEITTATELEPWRQHLLIGADEIERRGLCKWIEYDAPSGRVCFIGAVHTAITGKPPEDFWWRATGRRLEEIEIVDKRYIEIRGKRYDAYLAMYRFLGGSCPIQWNNSPDRTAAEVASAMRACARQGI